MKKEIPKDFNEALFYQRVGEFVVSFQWLENQFRQIGWFTIDPEMINFPNDELREESNNALLNKVVTLHDEFIVRYQIDTRIGYHVDFPKLVAQFHELRKFRNNLLHSSYHELKAGGEVMGIMRANPKARDFDLIEASDIEAVMKDIAPYILQLNFYFTQLKHWYWATVRPKTQTTS